MAQRRSHHRKLWLRWLRTRLRRSSRRCSFGTKWYTAARVSRRVISHRTICSQPARHFQGTIAAAACLEPTGQWGWIHRGHQSSLRKCWVQQWNGSQLLLSRPIPSHSCPSRRRQWGWGPPGRTWRRRHDLSVQALRIHLPPGSPWAALSTRRTLSPSRPLRLLGSRYHLACNRLSIAGWIRHRFGEATSLTWYGSVTATLLRSLQSEHSSLHLEQWSVSTYEDDLS